MNLADLNWSVPPTAKGSSKSSLASQLTWGTFAVDSLPGTLVDEVAEHDAAVDHSKDGEARDTSYSFILDKFDWDAPSYP